MSINAVRPSKPAPLGFACESAVKLPLLNLPSISCCAPTGVNDPPAIGEAYCCKRTVASMQYRDWPATTAMSSSPNSRRNSCSTMCSTFSFAAHWKRSPSTSSESMCRNSIDSPSWFCMKAAKRSGDQRPNGMRPLSRCGSARACSSAFMACATWPPGTVGGVFAKKIKGEYPLCNKSVNDAFGSAFWSKATCTLSSKFGLLWLLQDVSKLSEASTLKPSKSSTRRVRSLASACRVPRYRAAARAHRCRPKTSCTLQANCSHSSTLMRPSKLVSANVKLKR
mmetsp:Transcript_71736/g.219669  ORF Transcript_71736/g.219669 Transcript_71736/m.219669 type:complete len:281 (-) Transcript_71736:254-1096(-)